MPVLSPISWQTIPGSLSCWRHSEPLEGTFLTFLISAITAMLLLLLLAMLWTLLCLFLLVLLDVCWRWHFDWTINITIFIWNLFSCIFVNCLDKSSYYFRCKTVVLRWGLAMIADPVRNIPIHVFLPVKIIAEKNLATERSVCLDISSYPHNISF